LPKSRRRETGKGERANLTIESVPWGFRKFKLSSVRLGEAGVLPSRSRKKIEIVARGLRSKVGWNLGVERG